MAKQDRLTVVIRPWHFAIAAGLVAIGIASVVAYRHANPPPVKIWTSFSARYEVLVMPRCDNGRYADSYRFWTSGTATHSMPWPVECEGNRALLEIRCTTTEPGCQPTQLNQFVVKGSNSVSLKARCDGILHYL